MVVVQHMSLPESAERNSEWRCSASKKRWSIGLCIRKTPPPAALPDKPDYNSVSKSWSLTNMSFSHSSLSIRA